MPNDRQDVVWRPPFYGRLVENLWCPICDAEDLRVRIDSSADPRPAYCGSCHAAVTVDVFEQFSNPCPSDGDK